MLRRRKASESLGGTSGGDFVSFCPALLFITLQVNPPLSPIILLFLFFVKLNDNTLFFLAFFFCLQLLLRDWSPPRWPLELLYFSRQLPASRKTRETKLTWEGTLGNVAICCVCWACPIPRSNLTSLARPTEEHLALDRTVPCLRG